MVIKKILKILAFIGTLFLIGYIIYCFNFSGV